MILNLRKIFTLLVFAGWFSLGTLSSQTADPESEYNRIRSLALSGDHETARIEARNLVNAYPGYGDARILLARIMAWQKNYGEAELVLDTLLAKDPANPDALDLKDDISKWSEQPGISNTNIVAGYSIDRFTVPYSLSWQTYRLGASHKFKWGTGAASVNTGYITAGSTVSNRSAEMQFEVEAYPKISSRNYAFISYAFSPGSHFPSHRTAFEIWQVLPAGWVASAGLNYYRFDRNIFISAASVEKYAGKYWLSLKGFLYFKDEGLTTSGYFNIRRYLNDFDYLQLTAGSGTAPDEPFDIQSDLFRLSARSLRLVYSDQLKNKMTVRVGAGYSREEFAESVWRNRFEGNVTLTFPIGKR